MRYQTKGLIILATIPAAMLGWHIAAQYAEPSHCTERLDWIVGGDRPASVGTVRTCFALGLPVSKTVTRH